MQNSCSSKLRVTIFVATECSEFIVLPPRRTESNGYNTIALIGYLHKKYKWYLFCMLVRTVNNNDGHIFSIFSNIINKIIMSYLLFYNFINIEIIYYAFILIEINKDVTKVFNYYIRKSEINYANIQLYTVIYKNVCTITSNESIFLFSFRVFCPVHYWLVRWHSTLLSTRSRYNNYSLKGN